MNMHVQMLDINEDFDHDNRFFTFSKKRIAIIIMSFLISKVLFSLICILMSKIKVIYLNASSKVCYFLLSLLH